ncbi:LysM peptidoglycan-binding domain-containing protein [Bacillus tianshenii]|uniref:3D domain-containing protein n=1 Tax=Sutcliffiella tianshenii TaxID=1463404 RepID=UPI001CD3BA8A|nr:3D domain-containing protein [Bacillus tianshenii]MCA1319301.1 LysM peptidoglycan-binding domain-containing protein [Bacillus tianshenii]
MKKTMFSLVTAAALAGTFSLGSNASAAEVTVKKGDTLWDIANANNITVQELKDWNNLSSDLIHPEQGLKVALSERYKIVKGDTLWGISQNYDGITYQQLAQWNSIENPDLIYADDEIIIYTKGNPESVQTEAPAEEAPAEEPVTEAPAEEAPAEEPVTEAPAEEAPAEEPVTEAPAEEAPAEEPVTEAPAEEAPAEETPADEEVVKELTMTATAYTASCEGCSGITATGINLLENPDMKVISVDPSVIPLGSKVWVEGYGEAIAGDTGGAIKGNKIDIFIPDKQDAINYGVQEVQVKVYK